MKYTIRYCRFILSSIIQILNINNIYEKSFKSHEIYVFFIHMLHLPLLVSVKGFWTKFFTLVLLTTNQLFSELTFYQKKSFFYTVTNGIKGKKLIYSIKSLTDLF